MYCRNCGKELPNGSNYCLYCGANQVAITSNNSGAFISLLRKHQKMVSFYIIWFLIHLGLFLFSDGSVKYNFYPFDRELSDVINGYGFFSLVNNVDSYDVSELFFYVILIPIVIFVVVKIIARILKDKTIYITYEIWLLVNVVLFFISDKDSRSKDFFFPFKYRYQGYLIDEYDADELICYTIILPFIIIGTILFIRNSSTYVNWKKKQNKKEATISESNGQSSQLRSSLEDADDMVGKGNNQFSSPKTFEAELVTMPLYKRLLATIIDNVVISLMIIILVISYLIVSPYDGPGMLGEYTAFLYMSPKYMPNRVMELDKLITTFSVFGIAAFFGFAESRFKASLGKYLLNGILLDSDKTIINGTDLGRPITRLGLSVAFVVIFHFMMGLGYILVIFLYLVFMTLPILFTRQSLLDLMTGTIYAKRK